MLSKDCKVFQSFYKKKGEKFANIAKCYRVLLKESEKFANVAEPANMAEFLQMWQNLQCFQIL